MIKIFFASFWILSSQVLQDIEVELGGYIELNLSNEFCSVVILCFTNVVSTPVLSVSAILELTLSPPPIH